MVFIITAKVFSSSVSLNELNQRWFSNFFEVDSLWNRFLTSYSSFVSMMKLNPCFIALFQSILFLNWLRSASKQTWPEKIFFLNKLHTGTWKLLNFSPMRSTFSPKEQNGMKAEIVFLSEICAGWLISSSTFWEPKYERSLIVH